VIVGSSANSESNPQLSAMHLWPAGFHVPTGILSAIAYLFLGPVGALVTRP
jgi:hypothetical protein